MSKTNCPCCQSSNIRFREHRSDWFCDNCDHKWQINDQNSISKLSEQFPTKIFISYGRKDAIGLAEKLVADLKKSGYEVWYDLQNINPGESWQHEISNGLKSAHLVIAILSPHAVRTREIGEGFVNPDSVCLSEITLALFGKPNKPVIPVMGLECEPPLAIYHFDYIDLTKWMESEIDYKTGLTKLLNYLSEALQNKPTRYRSWYHYLQPWDFAAFLHEKRKGFVGRKWLFKEIEKWRYSSSNNRFLLITGDPGIGKSAIVAHLVHHNSKGQVIAYHCCQADTRATLEPWRFVRSIAAMLASRLPDYTKALESPSIREILNEEMCRQDPGSALERGILSPLSAISPPTEGDRYILIDALDESLIENPNKNIVDLLASRINRFPSWLKIVATTRKEPDVLKRLRGLPTKEIKADDPSNIEDLKEYITDKLRTPTLCSLAEKIFQSNRKIKNNDELASLLAKKSGGNFLFISQTLSDFENILRDNNLNEDEFKNFLEIPNGLYGMYENFFQRKFGHKNSDFNPVKAILEVICSSKEPLMASDLVPATGFINIFQFNQAWRSIAQFIPEINEGRKISVYRPFHKSLCDWLTSPATIRDSEFGIDLDAGHYRLAITGWERYQFKPKELSLYFLQHLPYHLAKANFGDKLFDILTDFYFLQNAIENGFAFEVARHYIDALMIIPKEKSTFFEPWFYFIRTNAGTLANNPESFYQLAFNEPRSSPVAIMALKILKSLKTKNSNFFQISYDSFHFYEKINRQDYWEKPSCLLTLHGHEGLVSGVSITPNAHSIATCADDKTIKIWDGITGECRITMFGHTDKVFAVAISKDGSKTLSGAADRKLKLWDSLTGQTLLDMDGHDGYVLGVAICPENKVLYSCSEDTTIRFWDPILGDCLNVIKAHEDRVLCIRLSQNGKILVSGSRDNSVALWDTTYGNLIIRLYGHKAVIFGVSISPDCTKISSVSQDGTAKIWNTESGKCEITILCKTEYFYDIDFSCDGKLVITGSRGGPVEAWCTKTGSLVNSFYGHSSHSVSVSTAKGIIASGSRDTKVKVWDLYSKNSGEQTLGQTATPMTLSLINNEKLAVGMTDESIKIWDLLNNTFLKSFKAHLSYVLTLAFSDKENILVSGSYDEIVRTWSPPFESPIFSFSENLGYVFSVAISPDGLQIIAGYSRGAIVIWNSKTGKNIGLLNEHSDSVNSLTIDINGKFCCSTSKDGSVKIWDLSVHKCINTTNYHKLEPKCVAFSPDGTIVATGGADKSVILFNCPSGNEIAKLNEHENSINSIAFLNSNTLITGSADKTIKLWDLNTYNCTHTLNGHEGEINALAITNNGTTIISSSIDGTIKIWNSPKWSMQNTFFGNPNKIEKFECNPEENQFHIFRQNGNQESFVLISDNITETIEVKSCLLFNKENSVIKEPFFTSHRGKTIKYSSDKLPSINIPGRYIQAFELNNKENFLIAIPDGGGLDIFVKRSVSVR